jgi:hypothetical protein
MFSQFVPFTVQKTHLPRSDADLFEEETEKDNRAMEELQEKTKKVVHE